MKKPPSTRALAPSRNGVKTQGAAVTLTASAVPGSTFAGWSPAPCAANFAMPGNDLACTATFTLNSYTIATQASLPGAGTLNCAPNPVNHGSASVCTIMPAANYLLSSVTGCGGSLAGNHYTTGAITAACQVTASFSSDVDGDGAANSLDNCTTVANPGQADTDGDGRGDACPVYYVNRLAAGGEGLSWATAFATLQDALDAGRLGGGEIWVAQGVYYPDVRKGLNGASPSDSNDPAARFDVPDKVKLLGGRFPSREPWPVSWRDSAAWLYV